MNLEKAYDREMEILEQELADGYLTQEEFNQAARELEKEFAEEEKDYGEAMY